jgi:hypothetical protein
VNVADAAPAGTVTDAGMLRVEQASDRATAAPPAGAAPDSVTVQVALAPEDRLEGEQLRPERTAAGVDAGAVMVRLAAADEPLSEAVTVTAWFAVTEPAAAVKVAVVAPAATVTEAGTVSALELSEIATLAPALGAAALRVTVQVELAPAATVEGEHWRAETPACGAGALLPPIALFISF